MDQRVKLLERIKAACPDLVIETVDWIDAGQFNHVAIVNGELAFRFPRYAEQARRLPRQVRLLRQIREHLNVAIPDPVYASVEPPIPGDAFIGYRMIPGIALSRETLGAASREAVPVVARQLATFLRALHAVPPDLVGSNLPNEDGPDHWGGLYVRIRERLFSHMQPSLDPP